MEPVSVGVIVAALIAKALDRAEDGVVDGAVEAARKAIDALRRRFLGDSEVEKAIDRVVDAPESGKRERALAEILEQRSNQSAELRAELEAIATELERAGLRFGDVDQVAEGNANTQIGNVNNSQINVSHRGSGD